MNTEAIRLTFAAINEANAKRKAQEAAALLPYVPGQVRVWAIVGEHARMHYVPAEAMRIVDGHGYPPDAQHWLAQHGIPCDRVVAYQYGKLYPEGTGP